MALVLSRSALAWAPTVALSWLWGLGFFYSIHVTLSYGWLGFAAFALPNAFGLFLFGWILGAPGRDPSEILKRVQGPYAGLFLLCQLGAVAITIFGFVAYLWLPMFGSNAGIALALVVLIACAVGHATSIARLKLIHIGYLIVGVAAALFALFGLNSAVDASPVPLASFDDRFYGLLLPSLVGLLLGPWMDVQQWQRVVEMQREGCSIRKAYGFGAILFFGLLTINAMLAGAAGTAGGTVIAADGVPGAQPAVALAIARAQIDGAAVAFLLWGVVVLASTVDSFYVATRWLLNSITARSVSPVLAFVPAGLVSSPLWITLAAVAVAAVMVRANLSMMYLMLLYATVFVGAAACLVCETLGASRRYDSTLCFMIGLTAGILFLVGYIGPVPGLLALAPLVALLGAVPMTIELLRGRAPAALAEPAAEAARIALRTEVASQMTPLTSANQDAATSHGFDGEWFVLRMIPTYDDTNSVGNVYFANYFRWVGKARELFFNLCMPGFDLKTTDYYVLTRSFEHDFRREVNEFEPVTIRIKISDHNRKFVTLAHEIHSQNHGLLGRGKQSLMFVDTVHYHPLDIPRDIILGFLPFWPKTSPHVAEPAARVFTPANRLGDRMAS